MLNPNGSPLTRFGDDVGCFRRWDDPAIGFWRTLTLSERQVEDAMKRSGTQQVFFVAAAALLLLAGVAQAQLQTGNLYGEVTDNEGAALPGVTITLSGIGAPKVKVTNAEGQFRFLGLSPGDYSLTAELEGFGTIEYPNINIRVGRNTTIDITMTPAIEDVITVTDASPLLDERKLGTGTTVTSVELDKIPTSRDPWGVVDQTPGVQIDRINVGGNESGQQSVFTGTGASSNDNVFAVDGVVITDMSAIGASPTYYDFDAFEEMQLSTGGTDISQATGGVTVNLVTKRGTNDWSGSARYYTTESGLQSQSGLNPADLATGQDPRDFEPNEIDDITDQGLELGGPIIKDRLWIWGAYGEQDISNLVPGAEPGQQIPDITILENSNVKLNAQLSSNNSGIFQWSRGDKIKNGRGAGPQRPPETTWNQSGPAEIWKLENTHIFNSNFYLTGLYSFVDGGFGLAPQGGTDAQVLLDAGGVWRRTFADFGSDRDVDQWRLDGSYFFNTTETSHELKFGTSYREAETAGGTKWGSGVIVFESEGAGGVNTARVYRGENPSNAFISEYQGFWAQDTITRDKLTINVGLRYDIQEGENLPFALDGSPLLPDLLPTLEFDGNDADGIEFSEITPRVGLTYAMGDERNTLLRFSYARFAQQLQQGLIDRTNPLSPAFAFVSFTDTNGNLEFDAGEPFDFLSANGFDPANPTALSSPNQNAPGLDPEITDEVNLSVEHSLRPDFVVGLNATLRNTSDLHERAYLVRDTPGGAARPATRGDFALTGSQSTVLPDGTSVTVPTFALVPEFTGGRLLRNGDRETDYLALSASFTKRLSNRWMLRGHLTWNDWEWDIPSSYFYDANDLAPGNRPETGIDNDEDFDNNGVPVAEQSAGSGDKGDILLNSGWSFNLNGMYQVAPDQPWGFNVAANIRGREGYPLPYYLNNVDPGDGIFRDLQVSRTGQVRNEDLYSMDLRFDKDLSFGSALGATLSLEIFNFFNEGTVLQRERNLAGSQGNFVDEVLSPRVIRLGVRVSLR